MPTHAAGAPTVIIPTGAGSAEIFEVVALQTLNAEDTIQITPDLIKYRVYQIAGNDSAVALTSDPQIQAGADQQIIKIVGTDQINGVTLGVGRGVALCGTNPTTLVISAAQSAEFQYHTSTAVWQQINCQATVDGVVPEPTALEIGFDVSLTGIIPNTNPDKGLILTNPLNALERFGWYWSPENGLVHVRPIGPQRTLVDANSPMEAYSSAGELLHSLDNSGKLLGAAHQVHACKTMDSVTGSLDNKLLAKWPFLVTITGVDATYEGSAPVTAAQFSLADGDGNAMTIADGTPVAVARTAADPTNVKAVTENAAAQLSAYEWVLLSVSNTPNPLTDTYSVCVYGKRR